MPFAIKPRQTVLFIGDSVTGCGRGANNAALGEGYVRIVSELIAARYPAHKIRVVNRGIGGNTVRDLFARWTEDALIHQPDWLSVQVGINDLNGWHTGAAKPVTPEEFADLYDQVLTRAKRETRASLVLIDPFYISRDTHPGTPRAAILEKLPLYLRTVEKMARKYKTRHIRTHEVFQRVLRHHPADSLCPEPIHPYPSGHLIMAHEWVGAVGW